MVLVEEGVEISEKNYNPSNVIQINHKNGLRTYQCSKCRKIYNDGIIAGCCCQ